MKHPATVVWIAAVVLAAVLVTLPSTAVAGGQNRAGTNAAPELLIPVGARDIALGGAPIATSSGLEALFWNPAGLARSGNDADAMFSHMRYIADIDVEYFAVSGNFGTFGSLGLSLKSVAVGDIPVTTEDFPDGTGQVMNPTVFNAGLTYARMLTDRISVGATITLISERFDRVSSTGFAISAGVQYVGLAGFEGLSLGVAVKNIGPQMTFDGDGLLRQGNANDVSRPPTFYKVNAASFELPSTIELGVGYTMTLAELNNLHVAGVFQNNNFSGDEYKFGAEYGYNNILFVRGGYVFSQDYSDPSSALSDDRIYIYGFTAGVGVHQELGSIDFTFDYAYRAVAFLDDNHIFSIKLGFK